MLKRPTHFVIPDVHCSPDLDNERLTALGQLIAEIRPDVLICLGDFGDFASLSSYDKGKKTFEGRRYKKDVESVRDGMNMLMKPIRKCTSYKPVQIFTLGNHENRINRAIDDDSKLDGTIGIEDLQLEKFGWNVYPFLKPAFLDGIAYSHYFASGINGKAISGDKLGHTLCSKLHQSAVVGHSHLWAHAESLKIDGTRIFGLSAGCFVHPETMENWSDAMRHLWWRGVVVLKEIDGRGFYDAIEAITMRKILRDYN